jgi:1-acyl-sn-glycerol-3-phosphate acyltransferase
MAERTISSEIEFRKTNKVMEWIGRTLFRLMGWEIDYRLPDIPKMVIIFAPHTSNWDVIHALPAAFVLGLKPNWLVKSNIYVWPIKWLVDLLGGVPIDRHKNENKVESIANAIQEADRIVLGLSPEGTRSYTEYWRSGFYHIAKLAKVPVHLGFIDYPSKTIGVHPGFIPSGDIEADMEKVTTFYKDKRGKFPENVGPAQFRPR